MKAFNHILVGWRIKLINSSEQMPTTMSWLIHPSGLKSTLKNLLVVLKKSISAKPLFVRPTVSLCSLFKVRHNNGWTEHMNNSISLVSRFPDSGNWGKFDIQTSKSSDFECPDSKQSEYRVSGCQSICRHDLISRRKKVRILRNPDIKSSGYRNMPFGALISRSPVIRVPLYSSAF